MYEDLKVGDRVHIRYMGTLIRDLVITSVDRNCLIVEHIFAFKCKTGKPCYVGDDFMQLIRKDIM